LVEELSYFNYLLFTELLLLLAIDKGAVRTSSSGLAWTRKTARARQRRIACKREKINCRLKRSFKKNYKARSCVLVE
jgi:hypothetical protein